MSRTMLVSLLLAALLAPLGVAAAPAAPAETPAPSAPNSGNDPMPAVPGPLDLYIYHSPGCSHCQKIVALKPDMLKFSPALRIILRNNTLPGAMQEADVLRRQGKIAAENWGPATAVFLGDRWDGGAGQGVLAKIHQLLSDRAEVLPSVWSGGNVPTGQARGPMQILAEFRLAKASKVALAGLTDGLSFPALIGLCALLAALVLAGGGARVVAALGWGYWGGAVAMLAGLRPRRAGAGAETAQHPCDCAQHARPVRGAGRRLPGRGGAPLARLPEDVGRAGHGGGRGGAGPRSRPPRSRRSKESPARSRRPSRCRSRRRRSRRATGAPRGCCSG